MNCTTSHFEESGFNDVSAAATELNMGYSVGDLIFPMSAYGGRGADDSATVRGTFGSTVLA